MKFFRRKHRQTEPSTNDPDALWATEDEQRREFRRRNNGIGWLVPHNGARAGSPTFGGMKSARNIFHLTQPHPDPDKAAQGWRIDRNGREWYSAAWIGGK